MIYNPENSVLDEIKDAALIRNLRSYAEAAGLEGNPHFIWQSAKDCKYLTKADKQVIRGIKTAISKNGVYGYLYTGKEQQPVMKFMAMTGILVRNYIDASYITMAELTATLMHGEEYSPRVLFIPDFFVTSFSVDTETQVRGSIKSSSKQKTRIDIPDWKRELVYSFLLKRMSAGKFNFLYVSDMQLFQNSYGYDVVDFIKQHYICADAE